MLQTGRPGWRSDEDAGSCARADFVVALLSPDEASERAAALEKQGTQRIMLQDFVPRDLDHVRLMGRVFAA